MEQVIKKTRKNSDKIILAQDNKEKVLSLLAQFDKWFGIVDVSVSDIVNLIISERKNELSTNEVKAFLKAMVNRTEAPKQRKPRQKKVSLKEAPIPDTSA